MASKSSVPPALHPEKAKRDGMKQMLYGIARFLREKGYWPKNQELARFLKAPPYAVQWYGDELLQTQYVSHPKSKGGRYALALTASGWSAISLVPFEPWSPRPGTIQIKKIARKVAMQVLLEQDDQRRAERRNA